MRTEAVNGSLSGGPEGPPYAWSAVGRVFRPAVAVIALVLYAIPAFAQFQMPDPREMSGIPRPVTDLADNTVSVRMIRGQLSNNLVGQPVELHILSGAGGVRTATTDQDGRAEFSGIPAGTTVQATATVDGEALESQEFPFPGRGGIRLMLVATDPNAPPPPPPLEAVTAPVVIGERSRIVIEPDDEVVRVYYLLEILNTNTNPANPPTAFEFEMPSGSGGAALLEGSTSQAQLQGSHLRVPGPFPQGSTVVQFGTQIPVTTGTVTIEQTFPAALQQVAVIVRKVGNTTIASPQITNQQEFTEESETYIQAVGPPVGAATPVSLTLSGLPHHSQTPRRLTLTIAVLIGLGGLWIALSRPPVDDAARAAERKRLVSKRDKLFAQLVRLEGDHRNGRGDADRYSARREELIAALERLYAALDEDEAGPDPSRAGLAA